MSPDQVPDQTRYDAIVVGSGSGGLTAAVGLSRFGRQVLMVERHQMGGDCTNVGCIPSKSLLHQARIARDDPATILAAVRKRRDHLREHEVELYGGADGITFVHGTARLIANGQVEITGGDGRSWRATADDIILSTGSSPRRLNIEGLSADRYLTNEEIFELGDAPRHLVIVGGGAVGLEMALAFRRLGSRVTVIEAADHVLPTLLPSASQSITTALEDQGIEIRAGRLASAFDPAKETLVLRSASEPQSSGGALSTVADVDRVLVAIGRTPNTYDLGLDRVGIEVNGDAALVVDDRGRTSAKGIWAVGDMTTEGGSTHLASAWGRRVVQSIAFPYLPIGDRPIQPAVVYTDPEVASIGRQPPTVPADVVRITVDGSEIDRAYTDEVAHGLLVVDVRRFSGSVLGATIVSPRASEIITTFSLAMKTGIGFHRWYGTVIPYPSYGEVITNAVDLYIAETAPNLPSQFGSWLRGRVQRWRRTDD